MIERSGEPKRAVCEGCKKEKDGCVMYGNEHVKVLACPECIQRGEEQFRMAKERGRTRNG